MLEKASVNDQDLDYLRAAIALAWRSREHGNHPFGALLVHPTDGVVVEAENTVLTERDCTGHAETNLMRRASQQHSREYLARCTLYTSTEPCAMCAGAIHWGNVGRVVYALSADALYTIVGPAPDHLQLPCREVFGRSERPIEVLGPALDADATAVQLGFWTG